MIYIVEDDADIRELVLYTLSTMGFSALGFERAEDFFRQTRELAPELVLLDIMLPGEDGLAILKKLKADPVTNKIPVIMVTARGAEYDQVKGLELGADDYISKPFGMMNLVSRIKAVLRRASREEETKLTAGEIELDTARHTVTAGGERIPLTLKEFELLRALIEGGGAVMTRDILLSRVWGYDFDGETRTVDVHIRTLRTKLGRFGTAIETVRGVGYRLGAAE